MIVKEYELIQKFLVKNHTKESLQYLKNRGLTEETIKHFGIGFIEREEIFNTPKSKNCITIPYYDLRNRIVAFFCRSIEHSGAYKYIGSYNFKYIYEKSRMLYNLNWVLRRHYNRKVFITEGQIDTMCLHQIGLKNSVAVIGSKMTDVQQELIYRYFDKVYLILDGDKAGDSLAEIGPKLQKLTVYKVKVKAEGCKDVNDMLKKGIDIKSYIKKNRELII